MYRFLGTVGGAGRARRAVLTLLAPSEGYGREGGESSARNRPPKPAREHEVNDGKGAGSRTPGPSRRSAIQPFIVMDVMRAAAERERAGGRVIHMEVGQPSASAPRAVIRAAEAALQRGRI